MSMGIIFPNSIGFQPDSVSRDALGRLRVSGVQTLWEVTHFRDKQPLLVSEKITGSATSTFDTNTASVKMIVGTASGQEVIRQSRQYIFYQPGRSQLLYMTGIMGEAKNNVTQRIGYFDNNNGIFFQQTGTGKSIVLRSNTSGSIVNTVIDQSNWNLDTLNGNGASGINIDWTKMQLFVIDFAWLGAGPIKAGFIIDGSLVYCHEFNHLNILDSPFMRTGNLPIRYSITTTGVTASSTTMSMTCACALAEAGVTPHGLAFSANRGSTNLSVGANVLAGLIAVRSKSTSPTTIWIPKLATLCSQAGENCALEIYYAPSTISGGIWTSINNSGLEYNTTFTSFSGGTLIASRYVASQQSNTQLDLESLNRPGVDVDLINRDAIVVAVRAITAGAFFGSLDWLEVV